MNPNSIAKAISHKLLRLRRSRAITRHRQRNAHLLRSTWSVYNGLTPVSLALMGVEPDESVRRRVNLLLPDLTATSVFAGARTALLAGAGLAARLDVSLRVLSFGAPPTSDAVDAVRAVLSDSDVRFEVESIWDLDIRGASCRDVWVATYWTTAHALQVAVRADVVPNDAVVYLVQDYEPSFYAASTESSLASATYRAGFRLIVNSRPLADFLSSAEGIAVPPEAVFRPEIDADQASVAARLRRSRTSPTVRVGFYGRPSKARNSFQLGVAALRVAASGMSTADIDVEFYSVGESHPPVELGNGHTLHSLGKLPWDGYFEFLASCPVMFSLQQTPHPSHIPLDAVLSGGRAVINEIANSRSGLSSRLRGAKSDPESLGAAIVLAVQEARAEGPAEFDAPFLQSLGRSVDEVLDDIAASVQRPSGQTG